jgi:hypothetical protein
VGEKSAPPPLRHNQQVPSQSVQAANANSSSLNDVFEVVATIFQQIMAELIGTEVEEENNGHHKNCIKNHETKWPLEFIGGKYDCASEGQQQL